MYDINTLDDLMAFYDAHHGGAQQRFMVQRTAIHNWRSRGIPAGWHSRIMCDLAEKGLTFDPSLLHADGHPGAKILNDSIRRLSGNGPAAANAVA